MTYDLLYVTARDVAVWEWLLGFYVGNRGFSSYFYLYNTLSHICFKLECNMHTYGIGTLINIRTFSRDTDMV